jgi:hypothetical protein
MSRLRLIAAAVLALAASANVHVHSQIPQQPRYRIAGTVVDSVTKEPLARVSVSVLSTPPNSHLLKTVLTDHDGHFSLPGFAAGKYSLTASRVGYQPTYFDQHETYNSAIVTGEGQDTENLTFAITAMAALGISVTDDFGEPVSGARVVLVHRVLKGGMGVRLIPTAFDPTDSTGHWTIFQLVPGDYYVAVSAHPWYALNNTTESGTPPVAHPANPALDVAYPTTYYDGTTTEAEATPITLAPGAHEHISIALHAVPALRITLPAPEPSSGQPQPKPPQLLPLIFGTPMEQPDSLDVNTTESGGTEFTGVAPGPYEVHQGDPPRRAMLNLAASQDLSATTGSATAAARVAIKEIANKPLPADTRVYLVWADSAHPRPAYYAEIEKNACTFDVVPPGLWSIYVDSNNKTLPIVSAAVEGKPIPGNLLRVTDKPFNLELTLRDTPNRVEGLATSNGKGKPGVMVVFVPQNPSAHTDIFRRDQSDSDGSFAFTAVIPGTYTVLAIENGWALEWRRPEVLARYLPGGVSVNIPDLPSYRLPASIPIQVAPSPGRTQP